MGSDRFIYLPGKYSYGGTDGYFFGQNVNNKVPGAYEASQSNPDSKWETSLKQNYGIDFNVLNDRLSISADYFIENRKDILAKPDYLPSILGMVLPLVNVGEVENKGYELQVKWNDQLNEQFRYWATFNMSYAKNKIVYKNEVKKNEPWSMRPDDVSVPAQCISSGDFMTKLPMPAIRKNLVGPLLTME